MKRLILSLGILAMATAAFADTYKWIDSEGGMHFTDSLDNVPAKYKSKVQKMEVTPVIEKTEERPSQPVTTVPEGKKAVSLYGGHNETWWRSSFESLRNEMKSIQDALPAKKEQFTTLHRKYIIYNKPRDRVASNEINAEIKRDEARLEELRKKLSDLETEASNVGVPTEWRK